MFVSLSLEQAQRIKGLLKFASTDQARPMLGCIRLEWGVEKDTLDLIATNSYTLGVRTFANVPLTYESPGGVHVNGKELWNALEACFKAIDIRMGKVMAKKAHIVLNAEAEVGVNVTILEIPEVVLAVRAYPGTYPKWRSLIPDDKGRHFQEGGLLPAFNPQYFKDCIDGIGVTTSKLKNPIRLWGSTPLKPFGFTYRETDIGEFLALIMPVRVED